jgi:hypothetical protein
LKLGIFNKKMQPKFSLSARVLPGEIAQSLMYVRPKKDVSESKSLKESYV